MSTGKQDGGLACPLLEVLRVFLKLGLISFGGPVAHIAYLREEFVHRRRWLDDAAYSDLVALCQFLPGPASSQLVFALGRYRAGWRGGLLASLGFTLPSAVLMILFGLGVGALGDLHAAGWLHGLKLAAVAVVAQAVWGMGRNLCPDRARLTICAAAAGVLLCFPGAVIQVGVILGGGAVGWLLYRRVLLATPEPAPLSPSLSPAPSGGEGAPATAGAGEGNSRCRFLAAEHGRQAERAARHSVPADGRLHLGAGGLLAVFLLLLLLLPILAAATGRKGVAVFDSFYRAGSLVFGGGHVILPLLRAEVVPPGWVTDSTFLAGYGAAQALPGPLFTFAGYLGTAMGSGPRAWLGGLWCLLAIFLPAWLLIAGALPFWHALRAKAWTQAALRGANAAIVGVLLAALYNPVWTEGVKGAADAATAVLAFGLLQWWKAPPWLVVLMAAAAGQWVLR